MLQTTRAVALRTFRHGDNSTVLKAYTERFGARTYLARTSKRGGVRPSHIRPLDRLELVVTEDGEREMHAIREVRLWKPYVGIPQEPARGLVLLFAQEVFYRTLREESPDAPLFHFVLDSLEAIDTGEHLAQLPLLLLVRLARHLGFLPEPPLPREDRFDLREGQFFTGPPPHGLCMEPPQALALANLLQAEAEGSVLTAAPGLRKVLLDDLLTYFSLHVEGFGQLRSPGVLHELLR